MRKMLLAACAVLALTGAARCEELELQHYSTDGWWSVESAKTHCIASSEFGNGTALLFGISAEGVAWMKVASEKWKIPEGNYRVTARVDSAPQNEVDFYADEKGRSLAVLIQIDEEQYNLITKGKFLNLTIGSQSYRYSLKHSRAMIDNLISCSGRLASASNPYAGGATAPTAPVSTPTNPFKRT